MTTKKFRYLTKFDGVREWHYIDFNSSLVRSQVEGWQSVSEPEIMQFTGRKDKHGKEIYEGDIVKKEEGQQSYISEVVFGKRTLGFGIHVQYKEHEYQGKKFFRDKFYRLSSRDEIVGNIYENPELLK